MKRSMSGKALAVLVAVVLLIGCVVGGTVARVGASPCRGSPGNAGEYYIDIM